MFPECWKLVRRESDCFVSVWRGGVAAVSLCMTPVLAWGRRPTVWHFSYLFPVFTFLVTSQTQGIVTHTTERVLVSNKTLMKCDLWLQSQQGLQSLETENDPWLKKLKKILLWKKSFRNFKLFNFVKCAVNFPGERMWASFVCVGEKDFSDKKSWGEVRKCKYLYGQAQCEDEWYREQAKPTTSRMGTDRLEIRNRH